MNTDLFVSQVARIANCHANTVLNYTKKGSIVARRDANNRRRYSLDQALKLKEILERRDPEPVHAAAC